MYLDSQQHGGYHPVKYNDAAGKDESSESIVIDTSLAYEKTMSAEALDSDSSEGLPTHTLRRPRGLLSRWLANSECAPPKISHSVALDGFRGMATCLVFQAHLPGGHEAWGQAGLGAFFIFAGFLLVGTLEKLYVSTFGGAIYPDSSLTLPRSRRQEHKHRSSQQRHGAVCYNASSRRTHGS